MPRRAYLLHVLVNLTLLSATNASSQLHETHFTLFKSIPQIIPGAKHLCEPNHNGYVDYKDKKIIIGLSFSKGLNYPKPQAIRLKVITLTLQCSFKQNILKVFFIYIF